MKHRFRNCYKIVSKFKKLLSTERGLYAESYKEEIVRNYFGDGSDFGVNISYKTQKDFLGTANAISYGEDFIDDSIKVSGDK